MTSHRGSPAGRIVVVDKATTRRPPDVLHHYTDANGLLGILRSNSLWATDLAYMNDTSELDYGLRLACAIVGDGLKERIKTMDAPDAKGTIDLVALLQLVQMPDFILSAFREIRQDLFVGVACLCESGDLLGQWRGYGGAGGYSIGFDAIEVGSLTANESLPLTAVAYDSVEQSAAVRGLRDRTVANLVFKDIEGFREAVRLSAFPAEAIGLAAQLKDSAFSEEREWRIGSVEYAAGGKVKFRSGGSGIVPFIELSLGNPSNRLPLKEIVVGPGGDYDQRAKAVRALLVSLGYDLREVKIRKSQVPYRDI